MVNKFVDWYDTLPPAKKRKHPSFSNVFQTLKDRGYIVQAAEHPTEDIFDRSLEAAARSRAKDPTALDGEALVKSCTELLKEILKWHSWQHISCAWVFTKQYWKDCAEFEKVMAEKKKMQA